MLERFFGLTAHGTTVRREVTAGLTTFAAMAYILAVNPGILSAAGMDQGALITATALASALMTAAMGLATNYPIALAPGMGMNAFFAFTICLGMGVPWQAALGLVFYSGLIFLVLSLTGMRRKLIEAIPAHLKIAITCGIGLFIAFIGLKSGGLIEADPATFVRLARPASPAFLLVLCGIGLIAVLVGRRWRGAIIISVLVLTLIGLFVRDGGGRYLTHWPSRLVDWPASLGPTFLALDLGYIWQHFAKTWPLLLALLFVDLFDNMGTLIAVCTRAGLMDRNGNLPRIGRALAADAGAAMIGSCLGTSTVTSYIESAAGVEEGGRTGLTALVVAGCFALALFFHPIIAMIPPVATAPALVVVGVFMMQGLANLELGDFTRGFPAVCIMILMPLTFSISEGLAIGFLAHVVVMSGTGRWREIPPVGWILALAFGLHLIFR